MRSPYELAYRYVVPTVKRELVEELVRRGLSKIEVSKLLRLSPSLISRYISGERGHLLTLRNYPDVMSMIKKLADSVVMGGIDEYVIIGEVSNIVKYVMSKKYLCRIHKDVEPDVDPTRCNVCVKVFT